MNFSSRWFFNSLPRLIRSSGHNGRDFFIAFFSKCRGWLARPAPGICSGQVSNGNKQTVITPPPPPANTPPHPPPSASTRYFSEP